MYFSACRFMLYICLTDDIVIFKLLLPHTVAVSSMVGVILTVKFSKNTLSAVCKSNYNGNYSGDAVL